MDGHEAAIVFALKHMTIEGKVTLGILLAMSLLSWFVIVHKGIALWRQKRASDRFQDQLDEAAEPLELVGRDAEFGVAPAYAVYEAASDELERQFQRSGGRKRLHQRLLPALVSVIERATTEESVRIESGTVILALAISGGPFIGLTGTVFGVMETFSGVAQAGQANLSAMAPGVAGALVNTIVGLIVAIPALFAYNILAKRIQAMQLALQGFASDVEARFGAAFFEDTGSATAAHHAHVAAALAVTH